MANILGESLKMRKTQIEFSAISKMEKHSKVKKIILMISSLFFLPLFLYAMPQIDAKSQAKSAAAAVSLEPNFLLMPEHTLIVGKPVLAGEMHTIGAVTFEYGKIADLVADEQIQETRSYKGN